MKKNHAYYIVITFKRLFFSAQYSMNDIHVSETVYDDNDDANDGRPYLNIEKVT